MASSPIEIILLILVLSNLYISYKGFRDSEYYNKYILQVESILLHKEYIRLLSSGFLHVNWFHLIFNVMALISFGLGTGMELGIKNFLIIYFASLLGGSLLALYIRRHDSSYSAAGASGAISGVIFSSIILSPHSHISFFFLPGAIPAWFFGIAYLLISLYGIKSKTGSIAHEAHVGGAIVGILATVFMHPEIASSNYYLLAALLIPFCVFMYFLVTKPEFLLLENSIKRKVSVKKKEPLSKQEELNMLLDKISQHGFNTLTKEERKKLDELSEHLTMNS